MTEQSATRIELEQRMRRLLGVTDDLKGAAGAAGKTSGVALGFLAALVAFVWGRRRGRRSRR